MSGSTEIARQKSDRPKKASRTQSVQLLPLMIKSATSAGLLLAVWGVGWMKFSLSWVIGASALYFVGKEFRKSNKVREEEAKAAEEPTLARVDELPSWVYFPDIERAEWLNKVVQQMWPYVGEHIAKTLRGFQDTINEKLPKYLQPFRFEDICLGDIPPRLGGVKVYIDNVKRDEIVLDAELSYLGDADINVSLNGIKAGVKDILLHGTVRVILRPLINKIPLVGGFEFCFLNPPNMDFDLTNFANALDMPILNDSLRKIITDQVSNLIVLPNFIRVDLCSDEDMILTRKEVTMPEAVIRVTLMEADDLKRADAGKIFGKGKSDPYCKISVGGATYSTKYKESTVRPRWDESFEFIVKKIQGQEIEVNVYDHDDHASDDFIGNTYIRIEDLAKVGQMDEWIKLSNVKTGRIHVIARVYYLTADANDPDRVKNTNGSTAILFVSVDSAKDLARRISKSHSKGLVEPSPFVTLQLGHTSLKTSSKPKTTNPRWEESFHLMVAQPENEALNVQVLDASKNDDLLGNIFFRLNKILEDEDMTLNRPFALEGRTSNATVTMRLCLRFLTTAKPVVEEVQGAEQPGLQTSAPGSVGEGGIVSEVPPATKDDSGTKLRYRGRQASVDSKNGRIQLTLRYNQEKEKLIVTVHKCMNLMAYDKDQFSDPYVRMYLLPDRSDKSKKKTEVMKNNLNPAWEESYEWSVRKEDIPLKTLEVMVKNFIGVFEKKTKTEMGVVNLRLVDFDNLSQPVSGWFDLQDPASLLSETTSFFSE